MRNIEACIRNYQKIGFSSIPLTANALGYVWKMLIPPRYTSFQSIVLIMLIFSNLDSSHNRPEFSMQNAIPRKIFSNNQKKVILVTPKYCSTTNCNRRVYEDTIARYLTGKIPSSKSLILLIQFLLVSSTLTKKFFWLD